MKKRVLIFIAEILLIRSGGLNLSALTLTALLILSGCADWSRPARLVPPDNQTGHLIGLAFMEEVDLNLPRRVHLGMTPNNETVSRYQALVRPGDLPLVFESRGAGGLYLAWLPFDRLPDGTDEVSLVMTGHEIRGPAGRFSYSWPAKLNPGISGPVRAGRVTYLGLIKREVFLNVPDQTTAADRPREKKTGPDCRVELSYTPDPTGRSIRGYCLDHPWLQKLLLTPCSGEEAEK